MNRSYHILGIVILTIGHSYLNEFYWIVLRFSDVGRCTKNHTIATEQQQCVAIR